MAMKAETKQKIKAILKRTGKALVLVLVVGAIAAATVFGLAACNNTNTNTSGNIDPVNPTPTYMVSQAWQANQSNVNSFVRNIVNEVKGNTAENKILYSAYDLGDKDKGAIDDVTVYMTVKGEGNERIYTVTQATFDEVDATNLRDGKGVLTNLVLEELDKVSYDETTFEEVSGIYSQNHDKILKAFEGNEFEEQQEYVAQITSTQTLVSEYPDAVDALANRISSAIMTKYQFNTEDVIFCGCKLPNADSKGMIDSMTIRVARKTGETERKVCDYRVAFDKVYLDKIADGTANYTNIRSAFEDEFTYDAKTTDPATIAAYYDYYGDSNYIQYVEEHFEDPVQDITIDDLIDTYDVNTALNTLYRYAVSESGTTESSVQAYQWDLGELNAEGKIENMKITIRYDTNEQYSNISVVDVKLKTPVTPEEFKSTTFGAKSATVTQSYYFDYNNTIQESRDALAVAILQNAGIDASTVDYLIKDTGSSTSSELGTVRTFVVSVNNGSSIVEISTGIQTASTDEGLIAKLQAGKAVTASTQKATFTDNMLDIVTFENEAQL